MSFHYLCRVKDGGNGKPHVTPFSLADFEGLFNAIFNKAKLDLSDPQVADLVRYRQDANLFNTERVNQRTIFGTFEGSYWGHSYENTAKGEIPADSISLRPFHYILYLSESGRIYIGVQYLGLFGGYQTIQRIVTRLLPKYEDISSYSFSLPGFGMQNAQPKEVRISFSDKSHSISGKNPIGQAGMIVFRKSSKYDGFEEEVSSRLFTQVGKSESDLKKAVAQLCSESKLIEVRDSDIEDCTVIAAVNGRRKPIHLFDAGSFATKFPINVGLKSNGHPVEIQTKDEMLRILSTEIITKSES